MAQRMPQISVRPLPETLQLVLSAEMHFAYQSGRVTVLPEMLGPGAVFRENDPVIAPARAPVRLFAREQAHPAGRARGIGTTGGVETNGTRGESVQILSLHDRVSGETRHGRRVFVGQDEENVGTLIHSFTPRDSCLIH